MADEAGQDLDVRRRDVEEPAAARRARAARQGEAPARPRALRGEGTERVPGDFTAAIYDAITKVFASTNPEQLFCLCWPGTVLEYERLEWRREEMVGGNMPEHALLRSSQILDQYIPPSPLTQPDGTRVSDRYNQAISQLGPVPNAGLMRLQGIVRERLQGELVREIDGEERTFTLVQWFGYLYGRWADASRRWGEKQLAQQRALQARYATEANPDAWWDAYLTWYGDNATGWVGQVNNRWQQLVAEFPLTEWEDAMSILETKDDNGLQEARTIMRNAVRPVPYQEGISYYPTTGVPYEWPLELKPVTKYIDLLADPAAQQMALETALAQLEQEIFNWTAIVPQIGDAQIQRDLSAFEAAQRGYGAAQAELIKTYGRNTVAAVVAVCEIMRSQELTFEGIAEAREPEKADEERELERKAEEIAGVGSGINWEQIERIAARLQEGQENLVDQQQALIEAGLDLARAAEAFLAGKANQSQFPWLGAYVAQLKSKLAAVQQAVADRGSAANVFNRYASTVEERARAETAREFAADAFPSPLDTPADDRWALVVVDVETRQLEASTRMTTSFSDMQWGVDLFLGSAGGTEQEQRSSFASRFMSAGSSIQIGFLATKVLIERPWMRPELFNGSASFFRSTSTPITLSRAVASEALLNEPRHAELNAQLLNCAFPAYPAAALLVKDVTVRVQIDATRTEDVRDYAKSTKSEGGGFLCFSVSKTSSSTSQSEQMNEYCMNGQLVMRAPAPQIVGYWVQLTPPDQSTQLEEQEAAAIAESLGFITKLKTAHEAGEATTEPTRGI